MGPTIQITFDAIDPARLADFWATAAAYVIQPPPEGFASWDDWATAMGIPEENRNDASALVDPEGVRPRFFFQKVPETKTAKNRVHLDLNVGGGRDVEAEERIARVRAEAARLVDAGAVEIATFDERDEFWIVMNDPEGNEFCLQ